MMEWLGILWRCFALQQRKGFREALMFVKIDIPDSGRMTVGLSNEQGTLFSKISLLLNSYKIEKSIFHKFYLKNAIKFFDNQINFSHVLTYVLNAKKCSSIYANPHRFMPAKLQSRNNINTESLLKNYRIM